MSGLDDLIKGVAGGGGGGLGDILGGLVDSGTSSGSGGLGDILDGLAGSAGRDSVGPAGSTPRSTHSQNSAAPTRRQNLRPESRRGWACPSLERALVQTCLGGQTGATL